MEQQILEAFERCQRRFPTVQLSLEVFRSRVLEILSSDAKVPGERTFNDGEAFARIHHEDLFLAIACSLDDRVAWEHFADDYLPLLRHFAAQACGNPGEAEDIAQEITAKLLIEKRRLAAYNGRGSLNGWLRVAVAHAAVDRFRRTRRQVSLDGLRENGTEAALVAPDRSNEENALDSHWGPVISRIAGECLQGFPAHDRLLLSLYHLQGVPLKDLGRQFGISEATASRWLDRMRREIRKKVEKELRKKHGLRSSEMQSLWKWISPSSLAESIGGSVLAGEKPLSQSVEKAAKKPAIGENPSVIKKEELR
jgi:RNA polymerase sigma-70 factor (ECF subfamily)